MSNAGNPNNCKTIRLLGMINGSEVRVMVDSGASHCLISEQMAYSLHLPIRPTSTYMSFVLANGSTVGATCICRNVALRLRSEVFSIACYVFPLADTEDILLGIQWLSTLGDVKANWMNLTMEFVYNGRIVRLDADHQTSSTTTSQKDNPTTTPIPPTTQDSLKPRLRESPKVNPTTTPSPPAAPDSLKTSLRAFLKTRFRASGKVNPTTTRSPPASQDSLKPHLRASKKVNTPTTSRPPQPVA